MNDNLHTLENGNGGWSEYRRLVVAELKQMNARMTKMEEKMNDIYTSIAILKTKAAFYGAGVALIVSVGMSWLNNRGGP